MGNQCKILFYLVGKDPFYHSFTDCGSPPKPNHGTVALNMPGLTTYGATATQSCKTGYTLSGDTVILCKSTGSWSASVSCSIIGNHVFELKKKKLNNLKVSKSIQRPIS